MSLKNKQEYNEYQKKYQLERYHKRRAAALAYLGGVCNKCGTIENLEIDHIDYTKKKYSISKLWSYSNDKFLNELNKCQLLCHNHHLEKTRSEGSLINAGGWNKVNNYGHGSGHMYNKDKCKCNTCKDWKRKYRNKIVDYMGNLRST